jgi:hypothetical protein
MYIGNRSMSILAVACLVLAFVLGAVVPRTSYRWPIGSHFYRADTILFWAFLIAGLVIAGIVMTGCCFTGRSGTPTATGSTCSAVRSFQTLCSVVYQRTTLRLR